ncbi:uncharacterized protein [Epargyreus clarus]|uniref:uncharacterized protein isoform X2 n=1 Tax=Epargyreus clarus TaxID=520877 RepID=UPI003C2E05B4
MIVEVCLLLRIVLNEHQHLTLQRVSVAPCGATKEPLKDVPQRSTLKSTSDYVSTDSWGDSPNLNPVWIYRPPSLLQRARENEVKQVSLRIPFSLTRLAKPLTFGFDPYFNRGYFEPFEKRQKPVTLVAFRRNGLLPRERIKMADSRSAEVAEIQSPFNEISNFWQDEPGSINE